MTISIHVSIANDFDLRMHAAFLLFRLSTSRPFFQCINCLLLAILDIEPRAIRARGETPLIILNKVKAQNKHI